MKRRMIGCMMTGAACLAMTMLASMAAAQGWAPLTECTALHRSAVEQVEPSVHDGARLLIDVLCLQESTGAINMMMIEPEWETYVEEHEGVGLFDALRSILVREVTADLFEARKLRMGL